ncbi:Energy-coupling factor transporter ATP-binding protein EcfA2 [bioreactor metagenome]|uniref:Energy-coupling factor transporter ATP-binding protein EcfA2 n=1 Tax=bioreactor metagenome TaxID=1076179 RepID=A0A644W0W4_9ZZZZ|nr:energy-coupling factor transporter ATPase [Acidaminococcaceae bacterium]
MSIEVKNISYTYMAKTPFERKALENVTLTIEKGEFVAIIGHTGSGKSTLAEHLNGLLVPSTGEVCVDGVNLKGKGNDVRLAKHKVGIVFQYPEHQIFAETIYEDIAFGPRNSGKAEKEVEIQVKNAMQFVGLDYDLFAQRSPFQLSGGQMRRVAIAGVIAMDPDYLVMDEPSAGLDPVSRDAIFAQLMAVFKKRDIAVILITHSMEEAAQYADRLLVMSKGQIAIDGKTSEVFKEQRGTLQEVGLDVPESIKLTDILCAKGLKIEGQALTKEQLVEYIKKAKGWS